jgi:hypothetical protein
MKQIHPLWIALAAILLLPMSLVSQTSHTSAFVLQRSASDGVNIRFELPAWNLETVSRGNESTQKVKMEGMPYLFIDEEETLPIFTTSVAIPYTGGATLSVLGSANHAENIGSMDFDASLSREREAGRLTDTLYPAQTVVISDPMILRDFRIVTINVYPFQYDQQTRQLHVNESIDIRI